MSGASLTYTALTSYFHNAALGHAAPSVSAGEISSALGYLLGSRALGGGFNSGFNSGLSSGFNSGTGSVRSTVTASLTAAQASVSRASASAGRIDGVNTALTQLGQIAGVLAPSAGGPFGDATTLPAVGTTTLPDTLQGNVNRAQRAVGLPAGPQQIQEQSAAQLRFNALRAQAQQLVGNLQGLHLSNSANQRAFDTAFGNLQSALASTNLDPNRVQALSFAPATGGGANSGGTFDASTPAGRAGARAAVDQLSHAIGAAQAALAPDRSAAHQQVTAAQSVVTQLTNFQSQVTSSSFSLGNPGNGVLSLLQFPSGGLANFLI